jgi:hypothetical protein
MKWRVYRLPGSRHWWLIDSGKNTPVLKATSIDFRSPVITVNDGTDGKQPISWLETEGQFHLDEKQNKAIFA